MIQAIDQCRREDANRALPRGRYRGARLFADTARAFAVRDGVLHVNGGRVTTPRRLGKGDIVRVGQTDFRVDV